MSIRRLIQRGMRRRIDITDLAENFRVSLSQQQKHLGQISALYDKGKWGKTDYIAKNLKIAVILPKLDQNQKLNKHFVSLKTDKKLQGKLFC